MQMGEGRDPELGGNEDEEMAMVTPRHDVSLGLPAKHTCQRKTPRSLPLGNDQGAYKFFRFISYPTHES